MHDYVQADAQAASRELREQLRRDAEEQVLGAIEYATGAVVRYSLRCQATAWNFSPTKVVSVANIP